MRITRDAVAAAILATLAAPVAGIAGGPMDLAFDRIVSFGDSLSDPGNLYAVAGEQSLAPYEPIPGAPYAIGGHHFSNGTTWIEQLAVDLANPLDGKAAFQRPDFRNFAFGGARARAAGTAPNLAMQIGAYLDRNGGADPEALHVLWIGANDVRDALVMLQTAETPDEFAAAMSVVPDALESMALGISALHASGARRFLVANVPNLGILPAIQAQGNDAIAGATWLAATFNAGLETTLDGLEVLPGIEVHRFDIWQLLMSVYVAPDAFGLSNSSTPCLSFYVLDNAICDSPEQHLFWDAVHPTTRAHGILANEALGLLISP